MQEWEPARKLAALRADDITQEQFDALIGDVMEEVKAGIASDGRTHWTTTDALVQHGGLSAGVVGEWLHGLGEERVVRCLRWLGGLAEQHSLALSGVEHGWGRVAELSDKARAGWAYALEQVRHHIPEDLVYQLTLSVTEVQGIHEPVPGLRENSATKIRVLCCQWVPMGFLSGTRYCVDLRALGRANGRWKISRKAHKGLAELVNWIKEGWEIDDETFEGLSPEELMAATSRDTKPRGWEVTFESTRCVTKDEDWRDGIEQFTATRHTLLPGRVVEVRSTGKGGESKARAIPKPLLPEGSVYASVPFHELVAAIEHLEHIEGLLDPGSEE